MTQFSQTQIDIISLNHTFMYLGRYTVGLTRHDAGRRTSLTCYTSTDNGTGCVEILHSWMKELCLLHQLQNTSLFKQRYILFRSRDNVLLPIS